MVATSEEGPLPSPQNVPEKTPLVFEQNVQDVLTKDKFRTNYLRKLSGEKVWMPKEQRAPKHQCLTIFDWDDTLMYTTFLLHSQNRPARPDTHKHLERVEKAAFSLLTQALEHGQTFIITNAMDGWVEQCVARHMPSLENLLQRVKVISARSTQEEHCDHVGQWKVKAFTELSKQLDTQTITNLVSVGDAHYEMEAAHVLGAQFPRSVVKTVKLQEHPSPEELMKELEIIVPKFKTIVEQARNMNIRLERKASAN